MKEFPGKIEHSFAAFKGDFDNKPSEYLVRYVGRQDSREGQNCGFLDLPRKFQKSFGELQFKSIA